MARVQGDPNAIAPTELARFHRLSDGEDMRFGDDYIVHMPGPWNGPVRIVDVCPTSFRFVTLAGHLEAGQIEFRASDDGDLTFEIESWARSGDKLSRVLYDGFRMAKEVQLHMWTSSLEQVVRISGGVRRGPSTSRRNAWRWTAELRLFSPPDVARELGRLRVAELNFDPHDLSRLRRDPAWQVDHYRKKLPAEPPGEPIEGGSWSIARDLSMEYEFVDPHIVRAFFDPKEAFEHRTMLLQICFWGLRIYAGVRVGGGDESSRNEEGREARVSAWYYRTLAGHFEKG